MKTALLLLILSTASLAHADILDDKADAGGQLLKQSHDLNSQALAVHGRLCDFDGSDSRFPACDASERGYLQAAHDLQKKVDAMVPTHTPLKYTRDQMALSTDDLMYELMDRREQELTSQKEYDSCMTNNPRGHGCSGSKKYLDFFKKTYGEVKADLIKKGGLQAFAAKLPEPTSLAGVKDLTVTLPKGSNFLSTDKGDADFTLYQVSTPCSATVKYTSFEGYSKMYTGSAEDQSWTIGKYMPGYSIDYRLKEAFNMCKALDGQKTQAACANSLQHQHAYHVPDSVVLSATDGSSRMTIYSSDESKKEQGVLQCLKAQNLKGLTDEPQVAGGTMPAPGHGTASN